MNKSDVYEALKNLVRALDRTYWSSWQSTANFDVELDRARNLIDEVEQSK